MAAGVSRPEHSEESMRETERLLNSVPSEFYNC